MTKELGIAIVSLGLAVSLLILVSTPINTVTAAELKLLKDKGEFPELFAEVEIDKLNFAQGVLYKACVFWVCSSEAGKKAKN